jgi:perosamine synthetase
MGVGRRAPIARGRVAHTLLEDIRWLLAACFGRMHDGTVVAQAEASFAAHVGREHCLVFPFARTAIHMTLRSLGLQPGDRVLLPPMTIKSILDVVLDLDLEPVFVDIDPATASFDSGELSRALEQRPKVAILTYLFGLVPDLDELMGRLTDAEVFVIEDFSQCLNGRWRDRAIGTFGDVSVYSASSIKTFDTFGGGFLVTDDAGRAATLASRGVDCATTSLVLISDLKAYPYQGATPNGARLYRSGMYLPCYHQLREAEADRIAAALEAAIR